MRPMFLEKSKPHLSHLTSFLFLINRTLTFLRHVYQNHVIRWAGKQRLLPLRLTILPFYLLVTGHVFSYKIKFFLVI